MEAKRDFDEAAAAVDGIINGPAFVAVSDAHKALMDAIKKP
jgi:hypothetical protein